MAEREAAVRAALAEGMGIRRAARLVDTGNATVARIAAEMRAEALKTMRVGFRRWRGCARMLVA